MKRLFSSAEWGSNLSVACLISTTDKYKLHPVMSAGNNTNLHRDNCHLQKTVINYYVYAKHFSALMRIFKGFFCSLRTQCGTLWWFISGYNNICIIEEIRHNLHHLQKHQIIGRIRTCQKKRILASSKNYIWSRTSVCQEIFLYFNELIDSNMMTLNTLYVCARRLLIVWILFIPLVLHWTRGYTVLK